MPKQRRPSLSETRKDQIRAMLRYPGHPREQSRGDELPNPPPPPTAFQPDPLVVGSPELAQWAKLILDLDPSTKAAIPSITQGLTKAVMRMPSSQGLPIDAFEGTNIMGITDARTNEIGLQPGMVRQDTLEALLHEITHGAGGSELWARLAEKLIDESQGH